MNLISIHQLNKSYPLVSNNKERLRGMFNILFNRTDSMGKQVLKDINLEVAKGESVAIIGKNGAGKSTLLKILSGVIQPTSGSFQVNGKIGALLELGSGFDPEYTGLENLKMSAAMYGLQGKEAAEKISKMIEFANIGDNINRPVKTYSSGMVVRLGFSVITQTRPDLLITDEVLAVGDEGFQLKCLRWIDEYLADGGTLLLVSHSIYHVQKLCQKAVWLEQGEIKASGDVFAVSQAYQQAVADSHTIPSGADVNRETYHIHQAEISSEGSVCEAITTGQDIDLTVKVYTPDEQVPGICIGVVSQTGLPVYGTYSELHNCHPVRDDKGMVTYQVRMPAVPLLPGKYEFRFHTMTPENLQMIDTFALSLQVTGQTRELGCVRLTTDWQ